MKTISTETTKKGNTVYYAVDENGKKRQVSRKTAQAIIASNNKEENKLENTVASMSATAEDMERIELNTAETDGSEEDTDDEEFKANVMPAEDDDSDDELVDPPVIKTSVEHKAQCTWVTPHDFKIVGNVSDSALAASNSRLAAFQTVAPKAKKTRKKTTAEEQQQKWLENAKVDENGKYYIVPELTYKGMELNKGWNPCFYIVTNDLKIKRIGLKFAIELAKADKAIEISKGGVKELKKAA